MYRTSIYDIPEPVTEGVLNHLHKFVYHSSLKYYEILKPFGLDVGNSFQDIGWSLYTFVNKEDSIGWGVFKSAKAIIKKYNLPESYGARLSRGILISESAFKELYDKIDSVPEADRVFYGKSIAIKNSCRFSKRQEFFYRIQEGKRAFLRCSIRNKIRHTITESNEPAALARPMGSSVCGKRRQAR